MRLYFVIHDAHATSQTPVQRHEQDANWKLQPFARIIAQRQTGPNEQLAALKTDPTGAYRLGGIDVLNATVREALASEARKIDARSRFPLVAQPLSKESQHDPRLLCS